MEFSSRDNIVQEMPDTRYLASPCSTTLLLFCTDTFQPNRVSLATGMETEEGNKLKKPHPPTLVQEKQVCPQEASGCGSTNCWPDSL